MEAGTAFALGLTAATTLGFVAVAALSLRPESGLRRWYGVDPDDDAAVRSNALVVGASGVGLAALAEHIQQAARDSQFVGRLLALYGQRDSLVCHVTLLATARKGLSGQFPSAPSAREK